MILLLALLLQDKNDPEAELKSFRVAEGFEISLFASEKDGVVKPIQMRWDPDGRLYVVCSPSYPQLAPGERGDDFIAVLEDSDRDGRADRSRVFARGLTMPMGLELGDGGVYAGDGSDLVHLRDTDGDGRADTRRVLLRGFYNADTHQSINNFVWGPGGELMFCQGLHIFSQVETPWGIEKLHKAGVWRWRPRRDRLDPFFGDDMGPQNPYGITFDDWGQPLLVAGNGQGVYYLLPAMIRTRHFRPYEALWNRGAKFGGADLMVGSHFPDEVRGRLVASSFMNNSVYWWSLEESGAGFRVKELPPLVVSSHTSFRPVDTRIGPDGAIYILDWYNPIIGHYQASLRHPDRDKTRGRIWRITAKGRSPAQAPKLSALATAEVLEQLKSPERWVRYQARRALADRDPREVTAALDRWAAEIKDERLFVEALGVHETHEIVAPALLSRALKASDPRARAYATNVIGHWHDRLVNPLDLLAPMALDPHPRVRLAAVVAASYVPDPRAVEVAASVADFPTDRFIEHALTQAVHALKPHWKPAFEAGKLSFGNRPERLQAVLQADGSKDVLPSLRKLAPGRENIRRLLARVGAPEDLATILNDRPTPDLLGDLAASARLRKVAPAGDPTPRLRTLLADPALQAGAAALAGLWKIEALRPELERLSAFEALADLGGSAAFLKSKAADPAAVVALTRVDLAAAAEVANVAPAVVAAFLARQGGAEALARALEGKPIPADAAKLALRAMSTEGRQDAALRNVLSRAAGISSAAPEYGAELVKALAEEAAREGDPARGEKVFRGTLTNCLSCHAIGGAGGRAGPDLSPVGTALPADLLIESLLWPNRQVKEGYTTTVVRTASGELLQGYKLTEDKQLLVLRNPNTDERVPVPVKEIEARKETGSLMPEGLTGGLTRAELRDLIRFLTELGRPGPYRTPDRPLVRRWKLGDGTYRFSAVSGELPLEDLPESGTLRFEVEVLKAGSFKLRFNDKSGLAAAPDEFTLQEGRQWVEFRVDRKSRTAGILCELLPAGGDAQLR